MFRGGSRERKRPAVDPRKRPGSFPEGAQFIKGRENPGFGFSPQIEFKAESKPEILAPIQSAPRQKPRPEWKVDIKPQLSQFSSVLEELSVSDLKYDNIKKTLARINSVYIHRLSETDVVKLVGKLAELLASGYSTFSVPQRDVFIPEFLQLARALFVRYSLDSEVGVTFYNSVNVKAFGDRHLGCFLSLLEVLLKNGKMSTEHCSELVAAAKRKLLYDADNSRIFTAKFLIEYLKREKIEESKKSLRDYLMDYCNDRCPKVRRIIIEGMEDFFNEEQKAPLEYYDLFTNLTENSDVFVKLSALRIVKLYSQFFPEEMVSKNRNFPLRLTDDAFTFVCHAMNDLVVDVRSQAAKLLGTFENVTESFLFQTLDKKLMKNMKRLADGRTVSSNSEWSTGKKLGEDCPVEGQEEEAQSLIPTGACGAFVSALEDEFKAVRQPAVYSLGKLAANRPIFANACIDHLADMFNDEIAAVRIDAIRALTPLVTYGTLELEQLKTLLTGFDDASPESRMALMELIGKSNFVQQDCLSFLLQRLLETMYRFPEDKNHIFECISSIGVRHAHLAVDIVSEIYKVHPYLQRKEEKIDDPFYLTKLILALNAASKSAAVRALLPEYAQKHYRFLRLAMPNLVCSIPEFDSDNRRHTVFSQNQKEQREDIDAIVGREYNRLMEIQKKTDFGQRERDFRQLLNDMKFFLSVEPQFSNASNYLYGLTELMMLMDKIINEVMSGNLCSFLEIQEAMEKLSFIEYRYQGVEEHVRMFLLECSLVLSIIYCRIRMFKDQNFNVFQRKIFLEDLTKVNRKLTWMKKEATEKLKFLMKYMADVVDGKVTVGESIFELNENSFLKLEKKIYFKKIGLKTVKIIEPAEIKNISLIIGLPTGVFVNCILNNFTIEDIGKFKIKIKYLDDTCAYFLPSKSDFEKISENQYRLKTNVIIVAKEGLILPSIINMTFGLFIIKDESKTILFYDKCYGFTPSPRTSANAQGYFVSLPNADDVLKPASCQVQTKPTQVKTIS